MMTMIKNCVVIVDVDVDEDVGVDYDDGYDLTRRCCFGASTEDDDIHDDDDDCVVDDDDDGCHVVILRADVALARALLPIALLHCSALR